MLVRIFVHDRLHSRIGKIHTGLEKGARIPQFQVHNRRAWLQHRLQARHGVTDAQKSKQDARSAIESKQLLDPHLLKN